MSVLVKGMKMPENCIKCPLQFGGWCYASPPEIDERVAPTVDEAWEQGKSDWCPLVELPDKHGRLVDVDALFREMEKAQWYNNADRDEIAEELVLNAPTIEPQRKKGKWIDRGWSGDGRGNSWHEWECSECKHITKGAKWNFCPNCGADMREDGGADADVES